jgi:hypothetical protein
MRTAAPLGFSMALFAGEGRKPSLMEASDQWTNPQFTARTTMVQMADTLSHVLLTFRCSVSGCALLSTNLTTHAQCDYLTIFIVVSPFESRN